MSQPLTAKVYTEVYGDIIDGKYDAQDIITESTLVEKYGVSKSPVREALIRLCNEDILKVIPRLGYMVVQITPREVRELTEIRAVLELHMLTKIFGALSDGELAELDELNQFTLQDARTRTSPMHNWQRNMAFHLKLASYAGNKTMYLHLKQILRTLARATTQYFSGYEEENPIFKERSSSTAHFELVDALKTNDLALAKKILENDINTIW